MPIVLTLQEVAVVDAVIQYMEIVMDTRCTRRQAINHIFATTAKYIDEEMKKHLTEN